jgi:uncharacterized membrane protein YbhN (UPF0104 family)
MWRAAFVVKVLVTLALLAWLASKVDASAMIGRLGQSDLPLLIAGTAFLALQPLLGAARWQWILRGLGERHSSLAVTQWTYVGMFFSQVLPASVGGDALRIWLACRAGSKLKPAVNSVVLDRVVMLLSLFMFIAACAPWYRGLFPHYPLAAIELVLIGGGIAAVFTLVSAERLPSRILQWGPGRWVASLSKDARTLLSSPKYGGMVMLLSLGAIFNLLAVTCIFALAFGAKASAFQIIVLVPPVVAASILPISIGGWGTREMAMVAALGLAGIGAETALLASIWLGLASILMTLPGAFFHFFLAVPVKPDAAAFDPAAESQVHGPG